MSVKQPARRLSEAEEARIRKQAANDPDAPAATDEQMAKARPFAEAFPELADRMRKNVGGRPPKDWPKKTISISLDQDVIASYKATGDGWQSRMNQALRKSAGLD